MLTSFLIWLQNLEPFSDLRSSAYAYPVVLALHLSAVSLFGAMIVATDLRLLGWALRDGSIADVIGRSRWPKRIGFLLAATCGFLLFSSKAEEYFYNPFFRIKVLLVMLVAVHALAFRRSVYRNADLDLTPEPPPRAKLAAGLSLFLWLSILCAGRYIGCSTRLLPGSSITASKCESFRPRTTRCRWPRRRPAPRVIVRTAERHGQKRLLHGGLAIHVYAI
jgi:hypothetical protein